MKFCCRCIFVFLVVVITVVLFHTFTPSFRVTSTTPISRYSYYVCTQIYNEPEHYLLDWLDYQFNVVGFKNVCVINVGQPLSTAVRKRYPIAYLERQQRKQRFDYCLSSCFVDEPMRPDDMIMVQDIDEYLNVRKEDEIFLNYDRYDLFHFREIRYGYVKDREEEMLGRSLRTTNFWRKPYRQLGEDEGKNLQALFNCTVVGRWPSCSDGRGKEMIRVGAIKWLSVHFHTSQNQSKRRLFVDMKAIGLNHYMMRSREDAIRSAVKWGN